jgi:hypothetical protein
MAPRARAALQAAVAVLFVRILIGFNRAVGNSSNNEQYPSSFLLVRG